MIGKKFGKWLVLEETDKKTKSRCKIYKCKCDCGTIGYVVGTNLRNGHSKSCGCTKVKHKHSRSKLYDIYYKMRHRCYNKRNNIYLTYNGKTQTIAQWSKELNIYYNTLMYRHNKGWSDKECLFGKGV